MTQPSLGDLTNQINQLTKSLKSGGGGKDLKLSPTAHQNYINVIADYRAALNVHLTKAAALADYGNPGSFPSAHQTKSNLQTDVHGLDGFVPRLKKYIAYLDDFEDAVNAAFIRFKDEDHGS